MQVAVPTPGRQRSAKRSSTLYSLSSSTGIAGQCSGGDLARAVAQVAGALAAKAAVVNVLTARARLKADDFKTGRPVGSWAADDNVPPLVGKTLRLALLCHLPSWSVEKLVGYATNVCQNEPLFVGLALSLLAAGTPAGWAVTAVKVYGVSRFVHAATFLFDTVQPTRAAAWLTGVFATLALAAAAFKL